MIARALAFTSISFCLGAAGVRFVDPRSTAEKRRERRIKLVGYFVIVHTVLACAWLGRDALRTLFVLVSAVGGAEIARAQATAPFAARLAALGAYILVASAMVAFTSVSPPSLTIYVYLIVAAFDGFSQVVGEAAGRRRLAPRVSPNKTVEGALGGCAAALATSLVLRPLAPFDWPSALAAGVLVAAAALLGDLSASWIKRRCAIKDFGALLPAQGGVIDRFDSFLFAVAAAQIFTALR
jgi:phosphatidate cytidylyltransferase